MKSFIDSLKKEKVKAKKRGETDERESDPIPYELYRKLCKYAIDMGNMFVWAFTVTQWACMARSISIDDMTFGQISIASDSLVIEYCDSKADQKGERTSPKNCYANPFDLNVCIFTALGCYFCTNEEAWKSQKDTIFRNRGSEAGTGSHRYCNQIKKIYIQHKEEIEEYIRANHFNPHGTRKGAAICASSGTTLPASLAAIANRGEWTVSMMFEIYLGFAEPGDQYLGRLLAGLNPNKATFAVIPPHFIEGMSNEYIKEAMELCFRGIIGQVEEEEIMEQGEEQAEQEEEDDRRRRRRRNVGISDIQSSSTSLRSNTKALLLRCLASMVHHSDGLLAVVREHNGAHPFASIPILNRPVLLNRLKGLVTLEESDRIRMPTGIPPHVEAVRKLNDLVDLIKLEREERQAHFEHITATIGDKMEEIALENGQVTRPAVEKLFQEFGEKFGTEVSTKIDSVLRSVVAQNHQNSVPVEDRGYENEDTNHEMTGGYPLFNYDGKFMQVPQNFSLPTKVKRKKAWELWICGMVTCDGDRIRPFRFFKLSMLPKAVQTKFKTEWQPILRKMQQGAGIPLPSNGDLINADVIDRTFISSTNHLKANVCSFLWERDNSVIENWSVASWSCYTQRSYIIKHGTENDKANLPIATRYNKPHRNKRTLKRKERD